MGETSPTPWTACDGAFWRIYDAANAEVVNAEGVVSEELSERICRAVNAHTEMVAELRQCQTELEEASALLAGSGMKGMGSIYQVAAERVRSALAKATGGEG